MKSIGKIVIRYISQLLKSIWLFFPSLLFLLLSIFCFWKLGQGKDIIIAFIKNSPTKGSIGFNFYFLFFFIAIAFWVYVNWYSSRIIAYIKINRQKMYMKEANNSDESTVEQSFQSGNSFFEIDKDFLDEFPRMLGNACFLIIELSLLQLPIGWSITGSIAFIIFIVLLIVLRYVNVWIERRLNKQKRITFLTPAFILLNILFVTSVITYCIISTKHSIVLVLLLIVLLHTIYVYYINLRRPVMAEDAEKKKEELKEESTKRKSLQALIMEKFCIPAKELTYYRYFIIFCIVGIVLYIASVLFLGFARSFGPFPIIILSFTVLLAFGNIVTAFSVRYKVNFHFLLLLPAILIPRFSEPHNVRTKTLKSGENNYCYKPTLKKYLTAWLDERLQSDSSRYDMYLIMANGGASRSGYWTAEVLGSIEDTSLLVAQANSNTPLSAAQKAKLFSSHIFCLSGTSGGGVGVAAFFSMLRNYKEQPVYKASAQRFLQEDYFSYTFARLLSTDYFSYITHLNMLDDRAGALEESFENSARDIKTDNLFSVPFDDNFSAFPALKNDSTVNMPIIFINTTRMQDGKPGVVSNLMIDTVFNGRIDVTKSINSQKDISMTTAAILGARFPYLSPAGRINDDYYVDGGYFDNSGAGAVQEIIRGIINIGNTDSSLAQKIKRLNFKVLHIVNSPTGFTPDEKKVSVAENDLLSPILTIVGAYSMQTTVNDGRLINYISDLQRDTANKSSYTQVSLYYTPKEIDSIQKLKPLYYEPAYAMNWFMSDTTKSRIDERLRTNKALYDFKMNFIKIK